MAYINKLIDINTSLNNIEDNINTAFDIATDAFKVNVVAGGGGGGGGGDGKAYLYNGAGTIPITSTNVGGKDGIDANIINTVSVSDPNINTAFDNVNDAIKVNIVAGSSGDGAAYIYNGAGTVPIGATNNSLDVNVSNANITVTGTVDISNAFALETTLSTLNGKIKSDTVNTDAIQVEVKNTSIPVTGTFWQATQPVSGTVAISDAFALETTLSNLNGKIKSDTVNTDAIQIEVKNTSIPVTGTFYQVTQPVSGTIDISDAFALESTLSTFNGKIHNDTTYTDAILVVDPNISDAHDAVNHALKVNIVDNTTTIDGKSYTYSGDGLTPITSTTVSLKNGLDTNIINTVAVSDSNIPANLTVASNNLQVVEKNLTNAYNAGNTSINMYITDSVQLEAKALLYDGSGTNGLTITDVDGKISLDVNVVNAPTTLTYLKDGTGNSITSTALPSSHIGIDTASSLYVSNGTTSTALTATGSALDVNISNATLATSDTNITNVYNGTNNTLRVNVVAGTTVDGNAYLYDGAGSNAITSTTVATSKRAIDSAASLYTSNVDNTRSALTSTAISSIRALDVNSKNTSHATTLVNRLSNGTNYITTETPTTTGGLVALSVRDADVASYSSSINTKVTTTTSSFSGSITAVNVYNIPKKSIFINFGGQNLTSEASSLEGALITGTQETSSAIGLSSTTYRIGNGANLKTFLYRIRGWVSDKIVTVRYCDGSNNLQTTTVTATAVAQTLASNIINVISCELAGSNQIFGATEFLEIYHTLGTPSIVLSLYTNNAAWITIPTGYRGIIRNFLFFSASAETIRCCKYNLTGDLTMVRDWRSLSNSFFVGELIYFSAGETFFWNTASGTSTTKLIQGMVELENIA